jgi:hypothetical protein
MKDMIRKGNLVVWLEDNQFYRVKESNLHYLILGGDPPGIQTCWFEVNRNECVLASIEEENNTTIF